MNILILLSVLSLLSLFCAWLYPQKFLRKIVLYDTMSVTQVIILIVPTILFLLFFILSYISITLSSEAVFLNNVVLVILFLSSSFGTLGVGIHFTGKSLSYNLKNHQDKRVRKNSYFFHILLGHHITFLFGLVSLLMIAILNLYNPILMVSLIEVSLLIFFGFLWSIAWTSTIVYAPVTRKPYIIFGWIFVVLIGALFLRTNMNVSNFPYTLFCFSTIFFISLLVSFVYVFEKIKGKHITEILLKKELVGKYLKGS